MQLAEEAVLGTILKENHLLLDANLKEEYFSGENKALFIAMKELQQKGRLVDLVTLLTHSNHAAFGGAGKLNKIQSLANVNKFDKYVEILVDKWREKEKLNILELARLENWNLNQHWQTSRHRRCFMCLVQFHHFHLQAHFIVCVQFLDSLHFRLHLLHRRH